MIRYIQSRGTAITVYSSVFKDIQGNSTILTGAQLGEKGIEKGPDCVRLWIICSIQNVVLILPRRKNSKIFPCRAFFSWIFDEIFFWSSLAPRIFPCPEKCMATYRHSGIILFAKPFTLSVWQCSKYASVLIIAQEFVQWLYVLHQTYSEFRTLFIQVYAGIFKHIQHYQVIFLHTEEF